MFVITVVYMYLLLQQKNTENLMEKFYTFKPKVKKVVKISAMDAK